MTRVPLLLALAFLLLAHAAAVWQSQAVALFAAIFLGLMLCWPLHRRMTAFFVALLVAIGLGIALFLSGRIFLLLMLPPVVFNTMAGLYFARTLRPGAMPLIERIVRGINDGQVPHPGVPAYARRLTLVWAVLLFTLALINLFLALWAVPGGVLHALALDAPLSVPLAWWSAFANGINYLVIGGFFVVEYAYRRTRFPNAVYRDFGDFLRRVAKLGPAFWRKH